MAQKPQDGYLKRIIKESNMADNPQPISQNSRFQSITEMTINILPAEIRVTSRSIRQEGINAAIRIKIRVGLSIFLASLSLEAKNLGLFSETASLMPVWYGCHQSKGKEPDK